MGKLYVALRPDELEQLLKLARAERRRPQDQAAMIIAQALREIPLAVTPAHGKAT